MKKAAVATTTAKGAAVRSSRITAVQSVYIGVLNNKLGASIIGAALLISPVHAGVVFDNCSTASDGSITCDTSPTGNTATDAVDAQYGLMDQASPGWNEFMPYQGFDDDFGGNWT